MRTIRPSLLLPSASALLLLLAQPAAAILISASTTDSAGLTNLTGVTTTERGFVGSANFVGVDVIHWAGSGTTSNAANIGGADPGNGNRATVMEDLALNTGLINPGDEGPLTVPEQALVGPNSGAVLGLGLTFIGGLVNGPGVDLVVFEIDSAASGDRGDGFVVSRLDGVAGSTTIADSTYTAFGSFLTTELIDTTPTNLTFFENSSPWSPAAPNSTGWAGIGVDLSDLGYDDRELVSSLFFSNPTGTSNNIDFMLIQGLFFPPVPEPNSGLLLVGALLATTRLRRRRRRKS